MNPIDRHAELAWRRAELRRPSTGRSGTSDDRLSSPSLTRLRDDALVEYFDGDAKLSQAVGRSPLLLANRPNGAILKRKSRVRTCAVTHSQLPQPTATP